MYLFGCFIFHCDSCNIYFNSEQYRYIYIGICNKMLFSIQHILLILSFKLAKKQSRVDSGRKSI